MGSKKLICVCGNEVVVEEKLFGIFGTCVPCDLHGQHISIFLRKGAKWVRPEDQAAVVQQQTEA